MKDASGKQITKQEFMKRWKEGIQNIPQHKQVKTEMFATRIIIIGILCGLIVSFINWKTMWWVAIVLVGALINTVLSFLSQRQKYKFLKQMEEVNNGFC